VAVPLAASTAPVAVPEIVASELVPVIVTVIVSLAVPSSEVTVRLSVASWPGSSAWVTARALSIV
jgi:hypothetical protein